MNRSGKLHALLSTARVANIPSVVSNVWVGVVIGMVVGIDERRVPWQSMGLLMCAGICLYVAGNFLNDWMDRDWDEKNRPERALPRGLFAPATYRNIALGLAALGVLVATLVNQAAGAIALAIVISIVIYTIWHKRAAWAVIPMGLCRAFLPLMGALGILDGSVHDQLFRAAWIPVTAGAALFCYIAGLSLSARKESQGGEHGMPMLWFLVPPFLLGVLSFWMLKTHAFFFLGVVPYGLWLWKCRTTYRRPIPRYVSALLAGIPLVDWVFLLPVALTVVTQSIPLVLGSLILPPLAFVLALLLQRIAPAT